MKFSKYLPTILVLTLFAFAMAMPTLAADHNSALGMLLPAEVQKSFDKVFGVLNDIVTYILQKRYIVGAFTLCVAIIIWALAKVSGGGRESSAMVRGAVFVCIVLGLLPTIVNFFVNIGE